MENINNQSSQSSVQLPKPEEHLSLSSPAHKWIKLIMMVVIIILIGSIGTIIYQTYQANQQVEEVPIPKAPLKELSPTIEIDETTGWRIYKNEIYKFEFQYPTTFILTNRSENSWTLDELTTFYITNKSPYDDSCRGPCPIEEKSETVMVDNHPVTKIEGYEGEIGCGVAMRFLSYVIPTKDSLLIMIVRPTTCYGHKTPPPGIVEFESSQVEQFTQILSTFRFLEEEKIVEQYEFNETGNYSGIIKGQLAYPSEGIPPGKIVAKNIETSELYIKDYPGTGIVGLGYSINVPPGKYHMKFEVPTPWNEPTTDKIIGYYTESSECFIKPECDRENHELITIGVTEGSIIDNVVINDYDYERKVVF